MSRLVKGLLVIDRTQCDHLLLFITLLCYYLVSKIEEEHVTDNEPIDQPSKRLRLEQVNEMVIQEGNEKVGDDTMSSTDIEVCDVSSLVRNNKLMSG